jgi:transposase
MQQLGIDISKEKFDVCLLSEARQPKIKMFSNHPFGFKSLTSWLKANNVENVHACMEGTGKLWEPLAEYLHEQGFSVSVVNPAKIKGYGQSELRRSKTDSLDAALIARFCKLHRPELWLPIPAETKAVRDRQRYIDALKDHRVQENNRLKSGRLDDRVREAIDHHIDFLNLQIKNLEEELRQLVHANESMKRQFTLLTSILGVGKVTATTVIGELGSLEQFRNSRQLEAFCGLTPQITQSGSSVRKRTRISKVGNWRVRRALYMPAICAIRTNPTIRTFAERLQDAGKPPKVIICAVMRKLLRIIFAVVRTDKPYELDLVHMPPRAVTLAS